MFLSAGQLIGQVVDEGQLGERTGKLGGDCIRLTQESSDRSAEYTWMYSGLSRSMMYPRLLFSLNTARIRVRKVDVDFSNVRSQACCSASVDQAT